MTRIFLIVISIISALFFAGCSEEVIDDEAPSVAITSPADGAGVTSPVVITASAADNEGVAEVTFYIDSTSAGSDTEAPFNLEWDISGLGDFSAHTIFARAQDAAGNIADSDIITVWINHTAWEFVLTETGKTSSAVSLAWSGYTGEIGSFRLHYDTLPNVDTTDAMGMTISLADTSATITGLLPDTEYFFKVFLIVGSNMVNSNELAVTTEPAGVLEWITVPSGGFSRGALDGSSGLEGAFPIRWIQISSFQLSETEITCAQFKEFMDAGGYDDSTLWSAEGWAEKESQDWTAPERWNEGLASWLIGDDFPDNPVAGVSYYEAEAYANWVGGRLTTEAEWEYAARGGEGPDTNADTYPDGNRYPWGNEFNAEIGGEIVHCNFSNATTDPMPDSLVDDFDNSSPVGAFPEGASWCGALDMAGNIAEWTSDWFSLDYYASSPDVNPQGPETGEEKVVRGGSFISQSNNSDPGYNLRTWRRDSRDADDRRKQIGFRVAKDN